MFARCIGCQVFAYDPLDWNVAPEVRNGLILAAPRSSMPYTVDGIYPCYGRLDPGRLRHLNSMPGILHSGRFPVIIQSFKVGLRPVSAPWVLKTAFLKRLDRVLNLDEPHPQSFPFLYTPQTLSFSDLASHFLAFWSSYHSPLLACRPLRD